MNRNMLLLNTVLLVLVAALGFTLRERWLSSRQQEREMLQRQTQAPPVIPPPPLPPAKNVTPAQYFDVADRTLFSKDRNPAVIADPPPPPPPAPPMPELPSYYGQIAIGDPVVLLSMAKTPQRSFRVGETIGEFKVLRFDRDTIAFDWKGKTVERNLAELRPKENVQTAQAGVPSGAPAGVGVANASATAAADAPSALKPAKAGVTSLSGGNLGNNAANNDSTADSMLGPELSPTERACVEGDSSATGTVHSGYRKVSMVTLLGPLCRWEKQP